MERDGFDGATDEARTRGIETAGASAPYIDEARS